MLKNFLFISSLCIVLVLLLPGFSSDHTGHVVFHQAPDTIAPYFKANDHKSVNVTTSNGVISLSTGLDNNFYMADSSYRRGFFYVETRVSKFVNDTANRVPLNISIVIDRSGSMQGVKMGYAKKAAKSIIDHLKPEDFVSIVIYDNSVDSIQPPIQVREKETIRKKIDGIVPRGSTNLWDGTEMGYHFVNRNYKEGFINRVLLISDGIANTGLTDSNLIRLKVRQFKDDNGITISTFGVGLDYNEMLMTDMAETGAGNYYFIASPEKMTSIFNEELAGLLSVAAREASLRINIPDGVVIEKAYPFRYSQEGNEITIKLRDLFSEETKGMLFSFRIDKRVRTDLKFQTSLIYTAITDGQTKTIQNTNLLSPVTKPDTYLTWYNKNVIEQVILFTANENLERAMTLVDRGDVDGANQLLLQGNRYLQLYGQYVRESEELKRMDSITMNYSHDVSKAKNLKADSLKKMQKSNRAANYLLRQKKN